MRTWQAASMAAAVAVMSSIAWAKDTPGSPALSAQTETQTKTQAAPMPGVSNGKKAVVNWALGCRGCHGNDARGNAGGAPALRGMVAQFLTLNGGRDYLIRVPGVAFSPLPDAELAELVNWMLYHFDPDHVPNDFKPYTAEEVKILRAKPLVSNANTVRKELLEYLNTK